MNMANVSISKLRKHTRKPSRPIENDLENGTPTTTQGSLLSLSPCRGPGHTKTATFKTSR